MPKQFANTMVAGSSTGAAGCRGPMPLWAPSGWDATWSDPAHPLRGKALGQSHQRRPGSRLRRSAELAV